MLAFMIVCEFLYIYTDPVLLFWIQTRTMTVSCPKDLSVGHLNIYHLANKVTDVNVFVHQSDISHIFGVSESRLTSYVSDEVVSIPNYSILRRDADEPGHTEIAVYVKYVKKFTPQDTEKLLRFNHDDLLEVQYVHLT